MYLSFHLPSGRHPMDTTRVEALKTERGRTIATTTYIWRPLSSPWEYIRPSCYNPLVMSIGVQVGSFHPLLICLFSMLFSLFLGVVFFMLFSPFLPYCAYKPSKFGKLMGSIHIPPFLQGRRFSSFVFFCVFFVPFMRLASFFFFFSSIM